MTRDVSKRRSPLLFWLPAGAGIAAIITLTGAVFLVQPDHTRVPVPTIAVATNHTDEAEGTPQSAQGPIIGLRRGDVEPAAYTPQQTAPNVSGLGPASVVHTPNVASSTATGTASPQMANQNMPLSQAPAGQMRAASTQVALNNEPPPSYASQVMAPTQIAPRPMPTSAQAQPQARALAPASAPARDVETVVVTAPTYQQPAFSVDTVGRGNSLVIQLPRTKRTP